MSKYARMHYVDGWMHWVGGWMFGWMGKNALGGWMDERPKINGWIDGWMGKSALGGWMDGEECIRWVDGWIDSWMDGWMKGKKLRDGWGRMH